MHRPASAGMPDLLHLVKVQPMLSSPHFLRWQECKQSAAILSSFCLYVLKDAVTSIFPIDFRQPVFFYYCDILLHRFNLFPFDIHCPLTNTLMYHNSLISKSRAKTLDSSSVFALTCRTSFWHEGSGWPPAPLSSLSHWFLGFHETCCPMGMRKREAQEL